MAGVFTSHEKFQDFHLRNEAEGKRYAYLGENGVFLGMETPLLEKNAESLRQPRPCDVLEALLTKGYGVKTDFSRRMDGLKRVADAMNKGDFSMARIAVIFAHVPPLLDSDSAERLAKADEFIVTKYNPNQERVPAGNPGGGQWGGGENQLAESCAQEWRRARIFCGKLDSNGQLGIGDYKGFGKTYDQCLRGQVRRAAAAMRWVEEKNHGQNVTPTIYGRTSDAMH